MKFEGPLTFYSAITVADLLRPNAAVGLADERPPQLRALRDAEDPTCPYYRFLYAIATMFDPIDTIEIGTYVGTSAAHLAHRSRDLRDALSVVTIDSNPSAKEHVDRLGYRNIMSICEDSTLARKRFSWGSQFDVLFIDGNHTFNQAWGEYTLYRDLIRDFGLILVDDANLEMDGDEMNVFWECIPEPKARADWLHATGFGIVQKSNLITPPSFEQVSRIARPMIESRRKAAR